MAKDGYVRIVVHPDVYKDFYTIKKFFGYNNNSELLRDIVLIFKKMHRICGYNRKCIHEVLDNLAEQVSVNGTWSLPIKKPEEVVVYA